MKQAHWKNIKVVVGILIFVIPFTTGFGQAQSPQGREAKRVTATCDEAPPLVPHDVEARKGLCQSCHGTGEGGAPITPHPNRTPFCIQCHIGQDLSVKPFVERSTKSP